LAVLIGLSAALVGAAGAVSHPTVRLTTPGTAEGRLDGGRVDLYLQGASVSEPPKCELIDASNGEVAPVAPTYSDLETGFAAFYAPRDGTYRLTCRGVAPHGVIARFGGDDWGEALVASLTGLGIASTGILAGVILVARWPRG